MAGHSSAVTAHAGGNPFLRTVAAISTLAGWASAAMIVLAVGITCQMIFVRFVLNASTIWQTEMVIYLVISATLVGLPYVQRLRGHVNVDLVPISLPKPARRVLAIFTLCASIAIIALMLWYGFENWHIAWARGWKSDTVWGVRLWIPYLAMPVGFGLFLLQLVADLVAVILKIDQPFGLEDT
jgi:TRAP-type C4-dicarboxylate transport system permease small subunit